ncbi:HpcH/HpaI aldolase/citrate lyase family protein [Sulfobacillus harzensis]|uniref:CoA ester lyase n=1 Tax=Sulfobacillus harzensis TaxID=2729629 RepID=A0A7Y0L711_9FIRM|nr:CoA ester lyase [Sulfobacillus harzensis]NMP24112.1 CoA ester lyase [Sulfobacillus harzensis]
MSCFLFVPAIEQRKFEKARQIACAGIILDLEDAVERSQKVVARESAAELLRRPRTKPVYVRINAASTPWWREDLDAIVEGRPDAVVVPKASDPAAVRAIDEYISMLEARNGLTKGQIRLELILETARAVMRMETLLTASPRVARATIGMADLCQDLGIDWAAALKGEPPLFLAERTQLAVVSRGLGLLAPHDSVFMDFQDDAGLIRDAEIGRRLGCAGKHVIHPRQIDPVNATYAITPEERERARRIVQAYEEVRLKGRGATLIDGLLVDEPVVQRAREVLMRTEAQR